MSTRIRPATAIVTGGARGIGRATALRLAAGGCAVAIADVEADAGRATAADIEAAGGRARFVATDVSDVRAVRALVAETNEAFGPVDALVAAAAVLGTEYPAAELPQEEWDRVLAINLTGVLHCCQAVLPDMVDRGWGRIVSISSHSRHGSALQVPYAVSKSGVVALISSIGRGYASAGVLANCVDPGRALTDMVVPRLTAEEIAHPNGVAIGRYAQPEEIAAVIAFLCSEDNTYAVGALWEAAGGVEFA